MPDDVDALRKELRDLDTKVEAAELREKIALRRQQLRELDEVPPLTPPPPKASQRTPPPEATRSLPQKVGSFVGSFLVVLAAFGFMVTPFSVGGDLLRTAAQLGDGQPVALTLLAALAGVGGHVGSLAIAHLVGRSLGAAPTPWDNAVNLAGKGALLVLGLALAGALILLT